MSTTTRRSSSPPPPPRSPVLLPIALSSPPFRRRHLLPPLAYPVDLNLDAPSHVVTRTRTRTVSAGPSIGAARNSGRARLDSRDRARTRSSPFLSSTKRSVSSRRSSSPPPTKRTRDCPPPVPPIPLSVLATYRTSVPASAPASKTRFSPMKAHSTLPSPPASPALSSNSHDLRIADIVPTQREADGVVYWDFGLPSPRPSPPPLTIKLSTYEGFEADDEESPVSTPTPALFGSCPRTPPNRSRRVSTGSRSSRATTIARFLGMAEPRFSGSH